MVFLMKLGFRYKPTPKGTPPLTRTTRVALATTMISVNDGDDDDFGDTRNTPDRRCHASFRTKSTPQTTATIRTRTRARTRTTRTARITPATAPTARQRLGPQTIHMYIHASASRGAMLLLGTFKFSEHVHLLTHKQNILGKRIFREYGRGERRESWFSEF